MRIHKNLDLPDCPRCESSLVLTTEWGWVDSDTCTGVLCCPDCRTEVGYQELAVQCINIEKSTNTREATESKTVNRLLTAINELVTDLEEAMGKYDG